MTQATTRQPAKPLRAKAALPLLGLLLAAAACAHAGAQDAPRAQPAAHHTAYYDSHQQPYALVRAGDDGVTMTGDDGDRFDVKQLRKHIRGDFLLFRDDDRSWVIQDPEVLAKARAAWAPVDKLGEQMDAYGRDMNKQGKVMDALGRNLGQTAVGIQPDPAKMRELERQMNELGVRVGELGQQMAFAGEAERARLDREMSRLGAKMGELGRQMGDVAATDAQRQAQASMKQISLRMNEASKPMNELGRKMHALGKEMERESHAADRTVRDLIRDAQAHGLARPAPQD